jgi:hypothetical protein
MKKYFIQNSPFVVPTTDGKLISISWFGNNNNPAISIAHMIAPPKWSFVKLQFEEFNQTKGKTICYRRRYYRPCRKIYKNR